MLTLDDLCELYRRYVPVTSRHPNARRWARRWARVATWWPAHELGHLLTVPPAWIGRPVFGMDTDVAPYEPNAARWYAYELAAMSVSRRLLTACCGSGSTGATPPRESPAAEHGDAGMIGRHGWRDVSTTAYQASTSSSFTRRWHPRGGGGGTADLLLLRWIAEIRNPRVAHVRERRARRRQAAVQDLTNAPETAVLRRAAGANNHRRLVKQDPCARSGRRRMPADVRPSASHFDRVSEVVHCRGACGHSSTNSRERSVHLDFANRPS